MLIPPKPPSLRGVLIQAKWVNGESIEQPTSSQPAFLNSSAALLKAIISVGHTKVKSNG